MFIRDSLQIKDNADKVKGRKKISHANRNEKKPGVAIFILEKIEFTINKKMEKRQRRTLHNYKGVNSRRGYNIYRKYLCTQHRSTHIYEAIISGHGGKDPQ